MKKHVTYYEKLNKNDKFMKWNWYTLLMFYFKALRLLCTLKNSTEKISL